MTIHSSSLILYNIELTPATINEHIRILSAQLDPSKHYNCVLTSGPDEDGNYDKSEIHKKTASNILERIKRWREGTVIISEWNDK